VEPFHLCRLVLAVIVTVSVWPVSVPLVALAYRVQLGPTPIPLERRAFWLRSTFAGLGLCVLSLFLVVLDHIAITRLELPAGPVHLTLLMVYAPVAMWFLFVMFALEDLLQGLGLLMLFILLPGLPLLLIHQVFGFWQPLDPALAWLPEPPAT
jgi:hypothetical protein